MENRIKELEKQLEEAEVKAAKWDSLGAKISTFYVDENDEEFGKMSAVDS